MLGYRAEMNALGLEILPGYERRATSTPRAPSGRCRRCSSCAEPPTAVFAAADMMAVGAIRAIHAAGLTVPGDVAIVGFDDIRSQSSSPRP